MEDVTDQERGSVDELWYAVGVGFEMNRVVCGSVAFSIHASNVFPETLGHDPNIDEGLCKNTLPQLR